MFATKDYSTEITHQPSADKEVAEYVQSTENSSVVL